MSASSAFRSIALRAALAFAMPMLACAETASAQATFDVSFDASASVLSADERAEITSHVQAAGRRWMRVIPIAGPRSIDVRISISDAPTANGASVTTALIGTIGGRETYQQGVAYELLTGIDPNDDEPDASIAFGLAYLRNELWFDPDPDARTAPVPNDRTDAMSTVLHELGHILAYNGWSDLTTGEPPATYWSVWDAWIVPGERPVFSGDAATAAWSGIAPDLTIGNINHWGNAPGRAPAVARCTGDAMTWRWNAPSPRRCDAPPSSDAPLLADSGAPRGAPGLIDQLMNGVTFYRGHRYDISPLDIGVLIDVGVLDDWIFFSGFERPVRD